MQLLYEFCTLLLLFVVLTGSTTELNFLGKFENNELKKATAILNSNQQMPVQVSNSIYQSPPFNRVINNRGSIFSNPTFSVDVNISPLLQADPPKDKVLATPLFPMRMESKDSIVLDILDSSIAEANKGARASLLVDGKPKTNITSKPIDLHSSCAVISDFSINTKPVESQIVDVTNKPKFSSNSGKSSTFRGSLLDSRSKFPVQHENKMDASSGFFQNFEEVAFSKLEKNGKELLEDEQIYSDCVIIKVVPLVQKFADREVQPTIDGGFKRFKKSSKNQYIGPPVHLIKQHSDMYDSNQNN